MGGRKGLTATHERHPLKPGKCRRCGMMYLCCLKHREEKNLPADLCETCALA